MPMNTFEHPKHGSFRTPEDVVSSDKLTPAEKRATLEDWRTALERDRSENPDAPEIDDTSERVVRAAATLGTPDA